MLLFHKGSKFLIYKIKDYLVISPDLIVSWYHITILSSTFLLCHQNGAAFQRMDGRNVMLSFQGGSLSASTGSGVGPDDIPLTDTGHLMTRPSSYESDQRYSLSQRDRLVSRHEKIVGSVQEGSRVFRSGSSSGSMHLGSSKKQDITDLEREVDLSEYDKFRPGKASYWMEYAVSTTEDEDVCPTCLEG